MEELSHFKNTILVTEQDRIVSSPITGILASDSKDAGLR